MCQIQQLQPTEYDIGVVQQVKVLARDPSTRLLDGQFQKWTGKKILNPFKRRGLFTQAIFKKNHGVVVYSEYVAMHRSIAKIRCFLNIETAGCQNLLPSNAPKYTVEWKTPKTTPVVKAYLRSKTWLTSHQLLHNAHYLIPNIYDRWSLIHLYILAPSTSVQSSVHGVMSSILFYNWTISSSPIPSFASEARAIVGIQPRRKKGCCKILHVRRGRVPAVYLCVCVCV